MLARVPDGRCGDRHDVRTFTVRDLNPPLGVRELDDADPRASVVAIPSVRIG
jgi:hypothetical protein